MEKFKMTFKIKSKRLKESSVSSTFGTQKSIESDLRMRCYGYRISYDKNKKKIWSMLNKKVKDTGEAINDTDTKEVCKFIAEEQHGI